MSNEALTWAKRQTVGSVGAKLLLIGLADHADADWVCWPGDDLLMAFVEKDARTLRRYLSHLEERGLIAIERTTVAGVTRRYRYRVDPPPNWSFEHLRTAVKAAVKSVHEPRSNLSTVDNSVQTDADKSDRGGGQICPPYIEEPSIEPPVDNSLRSLSTTREKTEHRSVDPPDKLKPDRRRKGHLCPNDWAPDCRRVMDWGERVLGVTLTPEVITYQAEKVRDWSHSASGSKGLKSDWDRFFYNWLRNANERNELQPKHKGESDGFSDQLREIDAIVRGAGDGPDQGYGGIFRKLDSARSTRSISANAPVQGGGVRGGRYG